MIMMAATLIERTQDGGRGEEEGETVNERQANGPAAAGSRRYAPE